MASKRTKYEHWLIGPSTSVLKEEFITKDFNDVSNDDLTSSLPFSGPLQLPTKMQALKLFWFLKDQSGRFNTCGRTNGEIQGCVARIINYYWKNLAAFETIDPSPATRQVKRIVDQYQKLLKSRSLNQPKANRDREAFLDDLKTCLNIGAPDLKKMLMTDRVRSNLNIVQEDVEFLEDQFGPRLMAMSHKPDKEFNDRKAANLKRKMSSVSPSGPSTSTTEPPANVDATGDGQEAEQQEDNEKDEDYVEKKKARSERITVSMPRCVFMSPDLISSLDRTKTSDYSAMRTFSSVFKTFQTLDGKPLSLTELVMSRTTIN